MALPWAQVGLLAVAGFWGHRALHRHPPRVTRWLTAPLVGLFVTLVQGYGFDGLMVCAALGVHWLVLQPTLWAGRILAGWQLTPAESESSRSPALPTWGVWRIIFWTVSLFCLFVVGQWFIRQQAQESGTWAEWYGLLVIFAANVVIACCAIWAALVKEGRLLWLALATLLVTVLTWAELLLLGRSRLPLPAEFVWWFNGFHYLTVLGTLLLVLHGGYRLTRAPNHATVAS
jgi:hypothetical protein